MDNVKYKKGGGTTCAVNGCTNNRRKLNLWKQSICEEHGVEHDSCACLIPFRFHVMPSDETKKMEWTKAINRKTLPKKVYVCSFHFLDGMPTDQNPYPKLNLGYETRVTPGRRKISKRAPEPKKRKLNLESEFENDLSDNDGVINESSSTTSPTHASDDEQCLDETSSRTMATQYDEFDFNTHIGDHGYAQKWTEFQNKSSQTNHTLTEEKGVQTKFDGGTMSAAQNISTDSDALLYTGVKKQVFFTLVDCMKQFNTSSFQMELADQLLMVLMKLKLNLIFDDLARRFGISKSLASKIFNTWIPVLADKLKQLVIWLPREVLRDCCPEAFKEKYPRTTCIIDCAETFIQRPTNLKSRGETYSNYKSHNTAKYLVGISPHGQIMYISKAFGGRASDKYIVETCGILNYLLPGDELMADRGFKIDDLLFPRQVKLNIPAFTKGKPQLSSEDVTTTRRIARVRIHVERAIRRLKVYKILSNTVPVSLVKLFDDILVVCSALVNLRDELIRDDSD